MSTEQAAFSGIVLLVFLSFFFLEIGNTSRDISIKAHYAILFTLIFLGFCSFIFSIANIQLIARNICISGTGLVIASICWKLMNAKQHSKFFFSGKSAFLFLISNASSIVAGSSLFSRDLIPSSMTGDPARHFQRILDLNETGEAVAHKPIYIFLGKLAINALPGFEQDKTFVIFNILVLGLSTSACMILFLKLFPASRWSHIVFVAPLVCFSYPLFSLIFGYYTLLLSSTFFFTALALLIDGKDISGKEKYLAPTLTIFGIILTHSYLLPDAVFSIIFFSCWIAKKNKRKILEELWDLAPFVFLIGAIAIISNSITSYDSFQTYKFHIGLQGYVNESFLLNIVPFVPFGLIYLLRESSRSTSQVLAIYIGATLIFTLIMSVLYKFDIAAPYYINRNQLALIPLLIFANFGFFVLVESKYPKLAWTTICLVSLFAFAPFALPSWNRPLSSEGAFRKLLAGDRFVYFENATIIKSAPLQMSGRDRELMRKIGRGESSCIESGISRLAVLGTDHESNWFSFYTGIYPSLFDRNDGFIDFNNYEKNYKMWRIDPNQKYIVILNHFDFWNRPQILNDIKFLTELICKGDSIAIYRKTSSG